MGSKLFSRTELMLSQHCVSIGSIFFFNTVSTSVQKFSMKTWILSEIQS